MTREVDFETAMRYVRATLNFSGFVLTEEEEKLLERRFKGEITDKEFHEIVLRSIGIETERDEKSPKCSESAQI